MAFTNLSNVIVPELWNSYVTERTAAKSAFWRSGIIADVGSLITENGGHSVNMPFFQDLTGADEVAPTDGTTALTVGNITAALDVAPILNRERAFGSQSLAGAMAGADPMDAIANLVAEYWARRMQVALISALDGAMEQVSDNVLDISALAGAAAKWSVGAFIDAQHRLGDNANLLSGIAVHSAVKAFMEKQDLIDFEKDSAGNTIATYRGLSVIVDDSLPVDTGTYTTYLFGAGAVGYAELDVPNAVETFREELKNNSGLITRRRFVLHPRGVAYTGTLNGTGPDNTALALNTNWTRRYEAKNIRIVQFKHKI